MKSAIDAYWEGNASLANRRIGSILKSNEKLGNKLSIETINKVLDSFVIKRLYRARIGRLDQYKRDDMFHIPFIKRGLIKNQRYSINGTPCLYLGTSAYVCWEELYRPDFNNLWLSRFEICNENLLILNLTHSIDSIKREMEDNGKEDEIKINMFENYFLSWILQCACSFIVENKKRTFKEEYIVPQLLMNNLRASGINGIMYLSVNDIHISSNKSAITANLAFPADDYKMFSRCNRSYNFNAEKYNKYYMSKSLLESFKLTSPMNMGLVGIESKDPSLMWIKEKQYRGKVHAHGYPKLESNFYRYGEHDYIMLSEDYKIPYKYTIFYNIEEQLRCMPAKKVASVKHFNSENT